VIPAACKRLDFYSKEHSGLIGQALLTIAREASSNPRQALVAVGKICMTTHKYGRTKMKRLAIPAMTLFALGFAQAGHTQVSSGDRPQTVEIKRNGSQPSTEGSADYFTGSVRINPLFPAHEPSRASGASVIFKPGARTAWHTHPLGQTLIVTAGVGWVQQRGEPIQEIRTGDVVWIPPEVKHWHGATATTTMAHIAIQEAIDGTPVGWMEQVSDNQYQAPM
jgi:quercetin dioxygenase-like cupin family protein